MDKDRPTTSAQQPRSTAGIFGHAKNTDINGGQFTTVVNNAKAHADGFDRLQEHVATAAFHNSAQRVDPPRCHENTRKAILQEIFDWIVQDAMRTTWIIWLNGAAGAGKSAIGQSIAELCIAEGIPVASFFFFRTDPTRNTIRPLVATLAYQVIRLLPATKDLITQAIESDPLIFEQSFDTQLAELIIQPLRCLHRSNSAWKLLLLIDGVDECDGDKSQTNLIQTIAKFLKAGDLPLIVLFGSRAEHQIKMAFNSPDIAKILLRLPLDDHYLPDNDIRLFLAENFRKIQETHPLNHPLNRAWPAPALVEEIFRKSSGQFIYASVVMKFVSFPRSNPATQLEIVRGLRPSGLSTPFAQLDALYRHIFSQIQDLESTTAILAYIILGWNTTISNTARFFNMPEDDVHTALADLTSVIVCDSEMDEIRFLHASLSDYLLDQRRSQEYHISRATWSTHLSILWFQNAALGRFKQCPDTSVSALLGSAQCSPDLQRSILAFNPSQLSLLEATEFLMEIDYFLATLRRLDFGDGGEVYRHQLNVIIRYINLRSRLNHDGWGEFYLSALRCGGHNISQILVAIELEECWPQEAERLKVKKPSQMSRLNAWLKK